MELSLIRTCFPGSTMAQLFKGKQLLFMHIGLNGSRGLAPVRQLPDGRYTLKRPFGRNGNWNLEVLMPGTRKPMWMDFNKLTFENMEGYDAPLHLSLGDGREQFNETAHAGLRLITNAIEQGDKVYITISTLV